MKNLFRVFGVILILGTIASCDPEEEKPNVDLAVTDIIFETEGIDPVMQDFDGTAIITVLIENIGEDDYISGANQQGLYIYQVDGYQVGSYEVLYEGFGNLQAGETISISYTRNWNISSPAEGEFPPNYRAVIGFDPDIRIDGNLDNDDADPTNNERTESGDQLNQL